jgi:hypothetical protein
MSITILRLVSEAYKTECNNNNDKRRNNLSKQSGKNFLKKRTKPMYAYQFDLVDMKTLTKLAKAKVPVKMGEPRYAIRWILTPSAN